jgi:hypothetical protein
LAIKLSEGSFILSHILRSAGLTGRMGQASRWAAKHVGELAFCVFSRQLVFEWQMGATCRAIYASSDGRRSPKDWIIRLDDVPVWTMACLSCTTSFAV